MDSRGSEIEIAAPAEGTPRGLGVVQWPTQSPGRRLGLAAKRGIDVAGAVAAGTILAPVLAWAALGVALNLGRPVFFRQVRPGLHGEPFEILKFRTMRPPRQDEVWYLTDEDRLTRLGRFLRASSIDELPQIWNVLRGEMSLVGPRPLLVEYLDTYSPDEHRRHAMRPGITGWAAVNGRHAAQFEDRLRLDVWYVDNWTPWLDMRIIALTILQVLRRTEVAATQDVHSIGFPLPGLAPGGDPLPRDTSQAAAPGAHLDRAGDERSIVNPPAGGV